MDLDPGKIRLDSVICKGTDGLTSYQRAINQASLKLCLDNPTIKDRDRFTTLARGRVHQDEFQYKKKTSRSKAFGNQGADSLVPEKKQKWSQELKSK